MLVRYFIQSNTTTLLSYSEIHQQAGGECKEHDKDQVKDEILYTQYDFQRSKVRDFRGRAGDHSFHFPTP